MEREKLNQHVEQEHRRLEAKHVTSARLPTAQEKRTTLVVLGMSDLTAVRSGETDPLAQLLAALCLALTLWLTLAVTWLLLRAELVIYPQFGARIKRAAASGLEFLAASTSCASAACAHRCRFFVRSRGGAAAARLFLLLWGRVVGWQRRALMRHRSLELATSDGEMEPEARPWSEARWWQVSREERRLLYARRHVRLLLRGRAWQEAQVARQSGKVKNRHKPYNESGAFFFPQVVSYVGDRAKGAVPA